MSFLQPAMLWFAGLASLPVLIYLFHRQRYTVMSWAAMAFLKRAVERNRKRLKIENWLLLALRVLAILLLVLAVSRPVMREASALFGQDGGGQRDIVIAFDTSFSMAAREGAHSAFERAREVAREILGERLRTGDRVAVVALSDRLQALYQEPIFANEGQGRRRVETDIDDLEPSASPGDLARGLAELSEYVGAFAAGGSGRTELYVLTDMQRSAWLSADGQLLDPAARDAAKRLGRLGVNATLIDCGGKERTNLSVADLRLDTPVAGIDQPLRFLATVENRSEQEASALSLELYVDGRLQRSVALDLEPDEKRTVALGASVQEPGVHAAKAVLKSDALTIDNSRWFAFEARDGIRVLLVDGEPGAEPWEGETDFLAAALAPDPDERLGADRLFRPQVVDEGRFVETDLEEYDVVVLANVVALPSGQAERLEAWVERGGALLIATGDQIDQAVWNDALWRGGEGCLPARLGDNVVSEDDASFYQLSVADARHPALSVFADRELERLLEQPRWIGYTRVELPERSTGGSSKILARFVRRRLESSGVVEVQSESEESGDPALVERRFGRGDVVLYASALDAAWSNFYYKPGYLILWRALLSYLTASGQPDRNLEVGEPFERLLEAAEYAPEIVLLTPAGEKVDKTLEPVAHESDRFRLRHERTDQPGLYRLIFRRREPAARGAKAELREEAFVVNVDTRRESALEAIDPAELRALFPGSRFEFRKAGAALGQAAAVEDEIARGELWRSMLIVALLLLFSESALGCWFGRRARA